MIYTNKGNISLTMAVWLANDDYDRKFDPNVYSATEILNPIRMITLTRQQLKKKQEGTTDIEDVIASRVGNAVHKAVETSWIESRDKAFARLNLPTGMTQRIRVNPDKPEEGCINIYIEQRSEKQIMGITLSGMYDFVIDGLVEDIKTTQTYNWISGSNDEKYAQQGSIYRWLNPEIIIQDYMNVQFLFTDWKQHLAKGSKDYPQAKLKTRKLPLMSIPATEAFIKERLTLILANVDKSQAELPLCTPEELWMNPSVYKWYKSGKVTNRSTKNFDSYNAAVAHAGSVGIIVEQKQKAKRCLYCDASDICLQAAQLRDDNLLDG